MKVLFISGELIGADVCNRLKQEGCDVRLYIEDKSRKDCLDGLVEKTDNWKKELSWVGKDGLIVFDDIGYGEIADKLRSDGYTVFGGNLMGDKLETDRDYGQKIFSVSGMKIVDHINFRNISDAISFLKKHKSRWVVKQNAHEGSLTYVGEMDDSSDAINILESYQKHNASHAIKTISLQKRIEGVEIAVARYFNGMDWVGPIFVSFEHKPLLNNDKGPLTAEMGTLAWHDENEKNKVFNETLGKLKPYLQKINYRGYADINSIANNKGIFPLEATMRFGSPTNHQQSSMYISHWHELLLAVARGEKYNLQYKKGFSIVVSIATPPFPYKSISSDYYIKGFNILFKSKLTKEESEMLHFEEVTAKKMGKDIKYYVAGSNGYIMFVTGIGNTVEEARAKAYRLVEKIVIPRMIYRTDIGIKFLQRDGQLLKSWGWL